MVFIIHCVRPLARMSTIQQPPLFQMTHMHDGVCVQQPWHFYDFRFEYHVCIYIYVSSSSNSDKQFCKVVYM